jgi:hypothetical protein
VGLLHGCGKPARFARQVVAVSLALTEALIYRASFFCAQIASRLQSVLSWKTDEGHEVFASIRRIWPAPFSSQERLSIHPGERRSNWLNGHTGKDVASAAAKTGFIQLLFRARAGRPREAAGLPRTPLSNGY